MDGKKINESHTGPVNPERRKAVKTLVVGGTGLAAYNFLPARWAVPRIESILLPAHAKTSGETVPAPAEETTAEPAKPEKTISKPTYSYVGSWLVADGPPFNTEPPCLTAQETAAQLFGGSPGDYAISTISDQVADIDFMAYVDVYATGTSRVAQDFKVDPGDDGYSELGDTSAYVRDFARPFAINYAFLVS